MRATLALLTGAGPGPGGDGAAATAGRDRHRRPVRPDRADPDRGHEPVPGLQRLHQAREPQGRGRGAHDHAPTRSTTSTRCRPRSSPTSGTRRRARSPSSVYGTPQIYALTQKLTEDRIPGTSPGFGSAAAADGTKLPVHLPDRGHLLVAGGRAVEVRQGSARRQSQGQEDRVHLLRQPGRARSRSRCSRSCRSWRASSCAPSRCRRRAWRWARRCSTSPSATGPTS